MSIRTKIHYNNICGVTEIPLKLIRIILIGLKLIRIILFSAENKMMKIKYF